MGPEDPVEEFAHDNEQRHEVRGYDGVEGHRSDPLTPRCCEEVEEDRHQERVPCRFGVQREPDEEVEDDVEDDAAHEGEGEFG